MIVTLPELALTPMDQARAAEFGDGVYDNTFAMLSYRLTDSGYEFNESPFSGIYYKEHRALYEEAIEAEKVGDEDRLDEIYAGMRQIVQTIVDSPNDSGVCDDVSQVYAKWPELVDGPRKFVIGVDVFYADTTPDWRWHKWGEYIGDHEPQHEHLGDEEGIERVVWFSIIEILGRKDKG